MSIKTKTFTTVILALGLVAAPATAKDRYMGGMKLSEQHVEMPPEGQVSRRWKHSNGCEYTRAGRPGERVWYLIINTVSGKDCVRFIVEKPYPGMTAADYYGVAKPRTFATRNAFFGDAGFEAAEETLLSRIENAWR